VGDRQVGSDRQVGDIQVTVGLTKIHTATSKKITIFNFTPSFLNMAEGRAMQVYLFISSQLAKK